MMHSWKSVKAGIVYHYNSDMSGSIIVCVHGKDEVKIPARDILDLAANYVLSQKVDALEQMDTPELLGVKCK